jgi:hypothetical protein
LTQLNLADDIEGLAASDAFSMSFNPQLNIEAARKPAKWRCARAW